VNRLQKQQCIEFVRNEVRGQSLVVVVNQRGVSAAASTRLRRALRNDDAKIKIVKNTLLRIAFAETEFSGLVQFFHGPTALVYSVDPIGVAKTLAKFISENSEKIQVMGCWLNGCVLGGDAVGELAKLPSMNELRVKIINTIVTPSTKIANILNEVVARVSRVIAARK
jgi:large subunit ribosomal protein L10